MPGLRYALDPHVARRRGRVVRRVPALRSTEEHASSSHLPAIQRFAAAVGSYHRTSTGDLRRNAAVPKRIILDCDPGVDDAWAIVLAYGDPEIELCGVTTVGGNASLAHTTANALRVCEFIGADVPVIAGCDLSEESRGVGGGGVHGVDGLGKARLPGPTSRPGDGHAVDYLIDTI